MNSEQPKMTDEPIIIQENPLPFKIRVKLLSNQVYEFQINPSMKVLDFKKHITEKVSVPVERMRLVFAGRQLKDEDPISEYVKESNLTVHLIARSADSVPNNNNNNSANQNSSQNQQSQPNQPQQNVPPNPFGDIMGMMGNLFGGQQPGQSGQGPQISMSFNNPNMGAINNLLGGFGIRLPEQPPQTQPPQQPPQQPAQQQQQQQPNQSSQQPPRPVPPQQNQQRISYAEISRLNQAVNSLNIPLDNVTTSQQILTVDGVARYLRRLYHQNTRTLMQLNRVIGLVENGDTRSLPAFIPVFRALNDANNVAIDSITRITQQPSQQPPQQSSQQSTQQPLPSQQPQQPPLPQLGLQLGPQMMQMRGMFSQLINPQQSPNNNPQPNQPQPQPPSQAPNMGINFGQLLNNMGGFGGLAPMLNMSIREMLQQGNQPNSSPIMSLLSPITGNNILQAFTTKNFTFLSQKHKQLRKQLMTLLQTKSRGQIIEQISTSISSLLVPTQLPSAEQTPLTITNFNQCQEDSIKIIAESVDKWIDVTLQQQPDSYSDQVIKIVRTMYCRHVDNVVQNTTHRQQQVNVQRLEKQKYALMLIRIRSVHLINAYAPGLAEMFYSLIERDLMRVYREHREEEDRKAQRSEEQAMDEQNLLKIIRQSGEKDCQYLANVEHSYQYFGEYPKQ